METNIERREKILELRKQGKTYGEISKELGCVKSLVAFYCSDRYDDEKQKLKEDSKLEYELIVCDFVKSSNNINQVCKKLGKKATNTNYAFVKKIIDKYNLDTTHFTDEPTKQKNRFESYPDEKVYCEHSVLKNKGALKKRLLKHGLKLYICEGCENTEWNGNPIPLQVHHVNGVSDDNRIENLQLLCPNCHALTDSYCGKNKHRKEKSVVRKGEKVIDKDELINNFIKFNSYVGVGKVYNVSDNAVRKWCRKVGLPTTSKEMKKFLENLLQV